MLISGLALSKRAGVGHEGESLATARRISGVSHAPSKSSACKVPARAVGSSFAVAWPAFCIQSLIDDGHGRGVKAAEE